MKYLVTGGAGFIGSHLVDEVIARDLGEVTIIDNLRRGKLSHIANHAGDPRVRFLEADIRDADAVGEACQGIDTVFHLAAQSNVMGAALDASYSLETNVIGTTNVLQAAQKAGVRRLVFSSSREVYGQALHLPVCENDPISPKNLYGASKAAGEMYCRAYASSGLDVRILRFANVYGPRDTERVIPLWLGRAREGLDLRVYGGAQIVDFVWVADAVDALIRASDAEGLPDPVNIGSGHATPILELAKSILELTKSPSRIEMEPARSEEVVGFTANVSRMKSLLDMEPPAAPLAHLKELIYPQN